MNREKKEKLMVIDGNSLIHRAFYALPLLSTKDGIYTNGVYGFLTMLYRIREEYTIDYICVAFDKKGPTFRHEAFDLYKANRQSTPNELSQQFPILKEILSAMNIAQLELDGYEADDIAGTLSKMGEDNGLETILVTGDKDYLQLASDYTKVLITRKGITELEEYDREKIIEEYGITPDQFIDLKGLMGDKSDNIPGVPGIGEKTGIKLLKEFGTMENLYDNIDKVGGKKTKESLIEHKNSAGLSKTLGKIIRNAPIEFVLKELKVEEPNWEELKKLYDILEFNSLLSKIPEEKITIEADSKYEVKYIVIEENNFDQIIDKIESEKSFCFKFLFEDENYIKSEIIGVGIKVGDSVPYYIDCSKNDIKLFRKKFAKYFESKEIEKYGHMMKMDIFALLKLDIDINNMVFDTMIGQYLLNPAQSNYSINELGKEYLNIYGKDLEELLGKGKNKKRYKDLPVETRAEHVAQTLDLIHGIREPINRLIEEQEMIELYYEVELPLVEVLANMEYYGFKVDLDVLNQLGEEFQGEIDSLTKEIYTLAGKEFNINSPKQMGEILFDELNLPVIKKTKTGYSTDAEVLDKLKGQHEIIEKILKYRQMVKLKSTYIDGLINVVDKETNKIHSSFNQTVTNTGRISSTEPNLQNIPIKTEEGRMIRKAFVAEDENYILVDADYSQIELRVLAHISKDPKLMEAFYHGEDIHTKTAAEVFHIPKDEVTPLMRNRAKAVNFGIVYGISDYGLSKDLNIPRKEAKEYIDNYLKNYGMVKKYMEGIIKIGKEKGYVETILNRRRYVPELKSRNYNVRSFGERIAMNTPIQGSAADIIKVAMVKVFKELNKRNLKSRLILQVHDELIIEAYKDEVEEVKNLIKDIMENSIKLDIPLKVDLNTGDNWYESK
ncbi:DNA polymerase I [[Clostridium] ultunense Esp]|uniref:DNA polymerase I n=2 Tax=Schnuerera ultunensis TaxID=45497 RepID=M1ZIT1_9FIRM|nr:DNA polymerase I [[Clostridium] ultunense Esp]SHD77965.1 DNA polymerase I [[Clostridium] ultunense Esp]